jgi:hypothetical protein
MTRGVRLYLVGSFVLVSLAGCGRGFFQTAEREPWRREAEMACLKSGAVHEDVNLVRIDPINGPGICGAEFPLKVAALDNGGTLGFADELRPPGGIPNASQPRWPITPSYPAETLARGPVYQGGTSQGAASQGPISLSPPGIEPAEEDDVEMPGDAPSIGQNQQRYRTPDYSQPANRTPIDRSPLPRLGPGQGTSVVSLGPVAVKPAATLACPIVSVLDRWMTDSVQPAAMHWFGAPVVEIKQISAYSCRGMNGNPNAHISEHAFGNALDIAAFTLSDGRRISVKDGWRGLVEEQGFLRDVQGAACQQFNTVLAPGSNVYHYDHIHVDLMRRASGRVICQPAAVSGDQVAARASQHHAYASEPGITGSIPQGLHHIFAHKSLSKDDQDSIEDESRIKERD